MLLTIKNVPIRFPYKTIYPEQYAYMTKLIEGYQNEAHNTSNTQIMLEMPTGTGKTACLIAATIGYLATNPVHHKKMIFCSRTVSQLEKVCQEIERTFNYYKKIKNDSESLDGIPIDQHTENVLNQFLAVMLTSRKNMCIFDNALNKTITTKISRKKGEVKTEKLPAGSVTVDAQCYEFCQAKDKKNRCPFYDGYQNSLDIEDAHLNLAGGNTENNMEDDTSEPLSKKIKLNYNSRRKIKTKRSSTALDSIRGLWTMDRLKAYGKRTKKCPYFLAKYLLERAQIVIYSYNYLLDPKIANHISKSLTEKSIVVFDEAHNIDQVSLEAMTCRVSKRNLRAARQQCENLKEWSDAYLEDNSIYEMLEAQDSGDPGVLPYISCPVTNDKMDKVVTNYANNNDKMPKYMRQPKHFLSLLIRLIDFMDQELYNAWGTQGLEQNPNTFIYKCLEKVQIKEDALRFSSLRLRQLVVSLKSTVKGEKLENLLPLIQVATFATLVATYEDGFRVILESDDSKDTKSGNFRLVCLDPAIALRPVLNKFKTVVLTSATLSPMSMYQELLDFQPTIEAQIKATFSRQSIKAVIASKGNDQVAMTSKFESRTDPAVVRNYGLLLVHLSQSVPDGMIAFFASYNHLENCCQQWYEADGSGKRIIERIEENKLIFVEMAGATDQESKKLMLAYKKACQSGRGAVLFAVARGRIAEGLDFTNHLARAVVVLGMPFTNTQSLVTRVRLQWIREILKISETDWLLFDACRYATQCLGRSVRGKNDYSLMVLADKRFQRKDRLSKLPYWLKNHLLQQDLDLTIESVANVALRHMKEMGNLDEKEVEILGTGYSLLTEEAIADPSIQEKCITDTIYEN